MAGPNIGYATLSVIPSMQGAAAALQGGIAGPASQAGVAAGGKFGSAFGAALKGGAIAGAVAVGVGVGLNKIATGFDDAFDTIRVGTGATGDALEGLQGSFKNVFGSVPTDMSSASTAIADLNTRLGLSGGNLEASATQFLNLSRITGGDLAGNIESVTRVFGDWGISVDDQGERLDQLFRASQATGIGVDSLSRQMVQYGAPLRQLGFEFDTTAALLGKFEKEGVNSELVMGSLRIALGKMAREGEDAQSTFQRVTEEIAQAGSASEANALALELFGARAGPDMAAAIREGRFELGDLFDQVAHGTETIASAAADTDDWRESWKQLKNKGLVAIEPIATRFFDFLGTAMDRAIPLIDTITSGIGWFFGLFERAPKLTGEGSPLGDLTAGLEKFQPVIESVVSVAKSGWDALSAIFQAGAKIVTVFWDRFGSHILGFLQRTVGNLLQIFEGVFRAIRGVFEVFAGIFTGDWSRVWGGIQQIVSGIWSAIQGILKQALEIIRTAIGGAMAAISQIWSFGWNALKTFVSTAWRNVTGAVRDGISGLLDWFRHLPDRIFTAIGDLAGRMLQFGKDLIAGLIEGALSMAGTLAKSVGDMVYRNTVGKVKGLLGMQSPSKVFRDIGRNAMIGMALGAGDEHDRVARAFTPSVPDMPTPGWSLPPAGSGQSLAERAGQRIGDAYFYGIEKPEDVAWALRKLALEMA